MPFDLKKGLTIKEVGTLTRTQDGMVQAELLISEPPRPVSIAIGDETALKPFLFEQTNWPKPLFGLEGYLLCFKGRIFTAPLKELEDHEKGAVLSLIRDFVGGPVVTIAVDLKPDDPLKRFKVIDGGAGDGEEETS